MIERLNIGRQLIDRCLITEPDIACLPEGKYFDEIERMLVKGVVCESERQAEYKARGLKTDIYEEQGLLFHHICYYGGSRDEVTKEVILSAVSRGLVSRRYNIAPPVRDISTGVGA